MISNAQKETYWKIVKVYLIAVILEIFASPAAKFLFTFSTNLEKKETFEKL